MKQMNELFIDLKMNSRKFNDTQDMKKYLYVFLQGTIQREC